jgi:Carboxypeptidase regulatory-like domain
MTPHSPTSRTLDQATPRTRRMSRTKRMPMCANGHLALAALLGCLGLLVLAPVAAAAGTGSIKGTVTNTQPKAVEGVTVDVLNAMTSELAGSATTEAAGEYEVAGLAAGPYVVEFLPPLGSEYIRQYYDDRHAFAKAKAVTVVEDKATEAINAELHTGGKVSGKVEAGGKGVEHVEVYVFGNSEGEHYFESSETNSSGEYTVGRLPEGEYLIEFFSLSADLAPLYYEKGESLTKATKVQVKEEVTNELTTVELQEGGEISGTVTDVVTHKPVAQVIVDADNARGFEYFGGYAETNEKGEYTIADLGGGVYNLEFYLEGELEESYIAPSTEDGVKVTPSEVTGISLALVPAAPNNSSSPVASGTPAAEQTLSCSSGSWTGVTPFKYAYRWLRDGSAVTGATGSTYVVQAADQGHGLSCEVTASNSNGHASATSNTLSVSTAPVIPVPAVVSPLPSKPQISVSTSKIVVSGSLAHVGISCKTASCSGTIKVTEQIIVKHREGKRTVSRKEAVVLGVGSFSLAAGHSGTFAIHLTKTGKSMLAHAKHHRLSAALVVSVSGGQSAKEAVVVSSQRP